MLTEDDFDFIVSQLPNDEEAIINNVVEKLKADKLEAYRAIRANHISVFQGIEYCVHCEEFHNEHDKDCIVLKAEKYINEVTK